MRYRVAVLAAVLILIAATAVPAQERLWSFSSSVNYLKGDYGVAFGAA